MKLKKKTKILLSSILATTIFTSVATTAAACTKKESVSHYKIFPTYASQADLMISLGIDVDYYPHQAYRKNEYDYINVNGTKFNDYILDKNNFKENVKTKVSDLLKNATRAKTWWGIKNDSITNDNSSEEYWTSKSGNILIYDRFLLDGSHEDTGGNRHLINTPNVDVTIEGDFKTARDIYTNFSKEDGEAVLKRQKTNKLTTSLVDTIVDNEKAYKGDLIYNYAYSFQKDLKLLQELKGKTNISQWLINADGSNKQPVFYASNDRTKDKKIAELYERFIIYNKLKETGFEKLNYLSKDVSLSEFKSILQHHPVYEQISTLSGAAMYTGAMRDAILNWYKIANELTNYSKTNKFKETFGNDKRKSKIENALVNVDEMATNLKERLTKIRNLFKAIGIVDPNYNPEQNNFDNTNSKTIGIVMVAPGQGVSTIQTQSKYGFMYFDLGFKAPFPNTDLDSIKSTVNPETDEIDLKDNPVFNMDDNGWWWNLGENTFSQKNTEMFREQFDSTFVLRSDKDVFSEDNKTRLEVMNKNNDKTVGNFKEDFNLWNDGIKSPIGYNMLLDRVVNRLYNQYKKDDSNKQLFEDAMNWGSYWNNKFIK